MPSSTSGKRRPAATTSFHAGMPSGYLDRLEMHELLEIWELYLERRRLEAAGDDGGLAALPAITALDGLRSERRPGEPARRVQRWIAMKDAQAQGASLEQIGAELGVTRQSAWESCSAGSASRRRRSRSRPAPAGRPRSAGATLQQPDRGAPRPHPAARRRRLSSGREQLGPPAVALAPMADPLVQAVRTALPELDRVGPEQVDRPSAAGAGRRPGSARRTPRRGARASRSPGSAGSGRTPRRRSGCRRHADGEVGVGLVVAQLLDQALQPDLALQRVPVDRDRAVRVLGELAPLAALPVGVEGDAALVDPAESTIRTDGRPSGVAVASAAASGSGTPSARASSYQA